jgi:hypothetical protein
LPSRSRQPEPRDSHVHVVPRLTRSQDNLESHTYEVFEKDAIKYTQYEEAVYRALLDRQMGDCPRTTATAGAGAATSAQPLQPRAAPMNGHGAGHADIGAGGNLSHAPMAIDGVPSAGVTGNGSGAPGPSGAVVLMVVGAGRGPLVAASMRASGRAGVRFKRVYAVEKNPNAVMHIQQLLRDNPGWANTVSACLQSWLSGCENGADRCDVFSAQIAHGASQSWQRFPVSKQSCLAAAPWSCCSGRLLPCLCACWSFLGSAALPCAP